MNTDQEKRNVPEGIKQILAKDVALTKYFIETTQNMTLFRSLKVHSTMLEVSCHGLIWLSVCLASIWLLAMPSLYRLQANLLIVLIFDIIVIAFMKAATRRRRPVPSSSSTYDLGPDKFSFPSGHASRAALILWIFLFIEPLPIMFVPPVFAWTTAVCISRIVSQRHYILDVLAGLGIGIVEGILFHLLWLGDDWAHYFISFLSDENFVGSEYHI